MITMIFLTFFIVLVMSSNNRFVQGTSEEEFKKLILSGAMQCLTEFPLSMQEMANLRMHKLSDSALCLVECTLKRSKVADSEGKLDFGYIRNVMQQLLTDDPEKLQKANSLLDACSYVNDEPVNQNCGRGGVIYNCIMEQSKQLGLEV